MFVKNFWIFGIVFEKKIGFLCFFGYLFLKFQKNKSQKLSMVEQNQGQIWNLHRIPHKVMKPNFQFSSYYSHDRRYSNRNIFFPKILIFFFVWPAIKKIFWLKKLKIGLHTSCRIQRRFQNCPCFYSSIDCFWLLFFWMFKKHILQESQIYIYKFIYWVLLLFLEAINASNQGTICSRTIF